MILYWYARPCSLVYTFTSYSEQRYALNFTVEFCKNFIVVAVGLDYAFCSGLRRMIFLYFES